MPFISANELTYHYLREGRGKPLVLLHGFTGRVENWAHLIPALARKYDTIALDLPGHGRTDAPTAPERYAMPAIAQDIARIWIEFALPPVHLWGYSMGGRLALFLAINFPEMVDTLILESASPGLRTAAERHMRRENDEILAARIEREGIAEFVDYWEQIPLFAGQKFLPEQVRHRHRAYRLRNRPEGLANSLRGMGTGAQPSLWPQLPNLQIPTHIIAGALDAKFVQIGREMAALMPRATVHIIPGAGHTVHLERPEVILSIVSG